MEEIKKSEEKLASNIIKERVESSQPVAIETGEIHQTQSVKDPGISVVNKNSENINNDYLENEKLLDREFIKNDGICNKKVENIFDESSKGDCSDAKDIIADKSDIPELPKEIEIKDVTEEQFLEIIGSESSNNNNNNNNNNSNNNNNNTLSLDECTEKEKSRELKSLNLDEEESKENIPEILERGNDEQLIREFEFKNNQHEKLNTYIECDRSNSVLEISNTLQCKNNSANREYEFEKSENNRHQFSSLLTIDETERPPVPLQTYRWEDIRREKEKGGYPWTHLYKKPLGPDEEPDIISKLRKTRNGNSNRKFVCVTDEKILESNLDSNSRTEPASRKASLSYNLLKDKPARTVGVGKPSRKRKIPNLKYHLDNSTYKTLCCDSLIDKIKTMADKKLIKMKSSSPSTSSTVKTVENGPNGMQKILKLKESPKAERSEIAHFIEKQDSDDIMEIIELEESPSKSRKHREHLASEQQGVSILVPDEIIELPQHLSLQENDENTSRLPPCKMPRKQKQHIYEDIDDTEISNEIDKILEDAVIGALKQSLAQQDVFIATEMKGKSQKLDDMGSSEEDQDKKLSLLAPISSIDSTSSDEERKVQLPTLPEENDQESIEILEVEKASELKSALKREQSPFNDKKVTFSQHTDEDTEPHREDIIIPEQYRISSRWSKLSDHEYEPIGEPVVNQQTEFNTNSVQYQKEPDVIVSVQGTSNEIRAKPTDEDTDMEIHDESYLSSVPTTPRTGSRTDNELHTSQVESSALEELPLKSENRKKSFMARAHDRSQRLQQNIRSQAGNIKTKLSKLKKPPSGSPKTKTRKKFKTLDFSKLKMPEVKKPDFKKFKKPNIPKFKYPDFKKIEIKKPDFSKIPKLDMSRFKIPEKFASLKLRRSKSLKESNVSEETSPDSVPVSKKRFDFHFSTYPRALRKSKTKSSEDSTSEKNKAEPSTESPTTAESSVTPSLPVHSRKGLIGSNWADKFSDVSYGESESGKYHRYDSEPDDIIKNGDTDRHPISNYENGSMESKDIRSLHAIDSKQFADFDEENRAIHEISKIREPEFKSRKPIVHQDSDLVSEESKELSWTQKDILRNNILTRSESGSDYQPDHMESRLGDSMENTNPETQSTGSSSALRRKGVIEEIDDDEFFLRKKGISEENIEIREYISSAIREGLSTPANALARMGNSNEYYNFETNGTIEYEYDVPPPKPRRIKQDSFDNFESLQDVDYSTLLDKDEIPKDSSPPIPPVRKQKFEKRQQDIIVNEPIGYFSGIESEQQQKESSYFDDIQMEILENKENLCTDANFDTRPKAPKRQKKINEFFEKEHFTDDVPTVAPVLGDTEEPQELMVYRTEHEYVVPLAQPESLTTPTPPRRRSRSRSQTSRITTDDDRTSHEAESIVSDLQFQTAVNEPKFQIEMHEVDGYAVIRKDIHRKPAAPIRRKRSSRSLDERKFSTMPLPRKNDKVELKSDYSTIGPSRPPRRKSPANTENALNKVSPDVTEYEELDPEDIDEVEPIKRLQSGAIINKMKYRPLPPPPRPPRDNKKIKDDKDDTAPADDIVEEFTSEHESQLDASEENVFHTTEVEVSTQTDPLPDDFSCEEFEITDDMRILEPRKTKTLEELLKEEQEAELERAKQLANDEQLYRSVQRFREANQRSFSEKSRASTSEILKNQFSRPTTPSAILIERRIPQPNPNSKEETMLEASLIVQPIECASEEENNFPELSNILEYKDSDIIAGLDKQDDYELDDYKLTEDTDYILKPEETIDLSEFPPPNPPPRRRSSVPQSEQTPQNYIVREESIQEQQIEEYIPEQIVEDQSKQIPRSDKYSKEDRKDHHENFQVPFGEQLQDRSEESFSKLPESFPSKLCLSNLEVDRLNVNAIEAGRIVVSQLEGTSINVQDLQCQSGNINTHNLQLPPDFIDSIIEQIRRSEQTQQITNVVPNDIPNLPNQDEAPPARPPPPQPPLLPPEYNLYNPQAVCFSQPTNYTEEGFPNTSSHRRRRHYRRRDSSSSDVQRDHHRRSHQITPSPEQSIPQLIAQLFSLCGISLSRFVNRILTSLVTNFKDGDVSRAQIIAVILIVLIAGYILMEISGTRSIHHHHWDYFNPPRNY